MESTQIAGTRPRRGSGLGAPVDRPGGAMPPWLRRTLIVALIFYNVVYALHHTPPHVTQSLLWDFSNVYVGSRAWLAGENPYDLAAVYRAWGNSHPGAYLGRPDLQRNGLFTPIYPPPSLVMLAPLAAMHAVPAHLLWLALDLVMFALMCAALCSMGRITGWEQRLLLVLLLLAWVPGLGVIIAGQLSVNAVSLVVLGVWAMRNQREVLAGLLLGFAAALKIQLGVPFIAYFLILRQWKPGGVAAGVLLVTTLIGVLPLEARGVPWLHQWTQNIHQTMLPGEVNDPRPYGPWRDDMISLQTLLTSVTTSDRTANALAATIFVAAGALFLFVIFTHTRRPHRDLLALSLVALICALPVYHRAYDMGVLALLGIWAARYLAAPSPVLLRRFAVITLVLLAELMIPFEGASFLERKMRLPPSVTGSTLWQAIVIPHHAWAILILCGWCLSMICAMRLRRAWTGRPVHPVSAHDDENELRAHVT